MGYPTQVIFNDGPQDPLFVPEFVHELGTAPMFDAFPDELIDAYEINRLKIVELVDPSKPDQDGIVWGWHNRNYTKDNLATASLVPIPGEHVQGSFNDSSGNLVDI